MTKPRRKRPKLRSRPLLVSCLLIAAVIIIASNIYQRPDKEPELLASEHPPSTSTSEPIPHSEPSNNASTNSWNQSQSPQLEQPAIESPDSQPQGSSDNLNSQNEQKEELTEQQLSSKEIIDKSYETEIHGLRRECRAKSNQLLQKIIAEVKSNEDATIKTLQAKFLGQLLKAEAGCDGSFQSLIDRAAADYEEAGVPISAMPPWKSQYSKEKAAVRASAIAKLAAAMQ